MADDALGVTSGEAMVTREVREVVAHIDGWLTDREVEFLFRTARRCPAEAVILEIGSFEGKSTVCLAKASQAGPRVKVYAVDPHVGSIEQSMWLGGASSFEAFKRNIERAQVDDVVVPIVTTSQLAAEGWDKPIGFLWIDGDHSYRGAKLDFALFGRWVVEGGIIAFHDATQGELPRVVCEAFRSGGFCNVGLIDSIGYATRSSERSLTLRDRVMLSCLACYAIGRRLGMLKGVRSAIKWMMSTVAPRRD